MSYWVDIRGLPEDATLAMLIAKINEIIAQLNYIGMMSADEQD